MKRIQLPIVIPVDVEIATQKHRHNATRVLTAEKNIRKIVCYTTDGAAVATTA